MNRRSFIKIIGLGAVAPIALVKAATKPAESEWHHFMGFKFVRTQLKPFTKTSYRLPVINDGDPLVAFSQHHARYVNAMKDRIILEALLNT
jgi:hypothetical protein